MSVEAQIPRRQQILETLARELEVNPATRVTTARLAQAVGVSEAALYRHFPSKAKMFEALIVFAEETVFVRITRIHASEETCAHRCRNTVATLLSFAEKNPGIARVLAGDALAGEHERLGERVAQFFDRVEAQLRQTIRVEQQAAPDALFSSVSEASNLLVAFAQGRMAQFVRSRYKRSPLEGWEKQWQILERALFSDSEGDT